ncbi:hypothetical protein LH51_13270 [Nitrincola sp. A-D6]|uniref:hypothetical protein n=1 Tax=Nitrincola sp. A-D6 TaxID=1545442 RepID=UPI00051FE014|nr:hypothetical protein [Nitrincola sp. A-D6]KGK41653.1 hypothetical protein LH51_13270 [Nitrincola sp. A-D6]
MRVIRNPTADIEHDGIGGRVSVKYRRIPQVFSGNAAVLGGVISEVDNTSNLFAGRANIWAGGPVNEGFGMMGLWTLPTYPVGANILPTNTMPMAALRNDWTALTALTPLG